MLRRRGEPCLGRGALCLSQKQRRLWLANPSQDRLRANRQSAAGRTPTHGPNVRVCTAGGEVGWCVVSNYCSQVWPLWEPLAMGRRRVSLRRRWRRQFTDAAISWWVLGHRDDRSGPPATPNWDTKHRALLMPSLVEDFFRSQFGIYLGEHVVKRHGIVGSYMNSL